MLALQQFANECNAAAEAFNFNSTNGTSASSVAIGTGAKSFTTQAGKSYVAGMTLRIANTADPSKWMQGEVTSYNSGTGALVMNITHTNGSGTLAAWTISLAAAILLPFTGTDKVTVHTGNGYASTDNKIFRFTTVLENLGASITYADNAGNGGRFTINTSGLYHVNLSHEFSAAVGSFGVSKSCTTLTTAFTSIAEAQKLIYAGGNNSAGGSDAPTGNGYTGYLAAGTVLRAHGDGSTMAGAAGRARMIVERLF
jgi:hypothetical protein